MSDFFWKLLHMFLSCNQIFCHIFEEIFYANLDAHIKKLLKQKIQPISESQICQSFSKPRSNLGMLQLQVGNVQLNMTLQDNQWDKTPKSIATTANRIEKFYKILTFETYIFNIEINGSSQ